MGTAKLKRAEPSQEKASTKAHLMQVSEELIGLYGLDGISLREIAASAGQANVNAVQYHFKDKQGLIRAILDDRTLRTETVRREMLAQLIADGETKSLRRLLAAMILPTLTFHNPRSGHVFCRFLLQCYIHPDSGYHDIDGLYQALVNAKAKAKAGAQQLAVVQIVELMQQLFKGVPPIALMSRLKAVHLMFVACVVEFDNARSAGKRAERFNPEPILDMAVGALSAPHD